MAYVGLFRSPAGLNMTARYDGDIPGWGGLARHDKLVLGDFDGDGRCDVYIFNGDDWSMTYLGMFRSSGTAGYVRRYDGDVPGWGGLARHDQFFAADIDGNGRCDLGRGTTRTGRRSTSADDLVRHRPRGQLHGRLGGRVEPRSVDAFEVARFGGRSGKKATQRTSTSTTPTGSG